jgi:hypothetical protein
MFPTLASTSLTSAHDWFVLIVSIVILGLFIGIGYWILKTFIIPNVPEPFRWVINVLIGLALLGLLFFFFFGTV